jgi:gas vesicle protein
MLNKALYFIAGAAVGAVVTYFMVNKKAQERADKEVEEVTERLHIRYKKDEADEVVKKNEARKEELLDKVNSNLSEAIPEMSPEDKDTFKKYSEIIQRHGYLKRKTINVITEDDFKDPQFDDYYKQLGYLYYLDGTVANELDEELEWHEIEDSIGVDFMAYFRDNPKEEICHVRNDERRVDYEIQRVDDFHESTVVPSDYDDNADESEGEE